MKKIILLLITLYGNAYCQGSMLTYERTEGNAKITGHGTAFGIDKRLMLTCAHNVLNEQNNPYKTILVSGFRCKVLRFDLKYDIALLEASVDVSVEQMGEDAGVGEKIVLSGSKRGEPVTESKGKIVELNHGGACRDRLEVSFDHGDSGGPVLKDGKVVGMAVAGIPKEGDLAHDQGLFVRVSILKEFLKR